MKRIRDLVGKKFGKLIVIRLSEERGGANKKLMKWICECDCGKEVIVFGTNLTRNHTTSCGCYMAACVSARRKTHGLSKTPEYHRWTGIIQRCTNPNDLAYHNYGGRGIKVCDRWLNSFEAYLQDVGPCPGPEYSLDRHPNNDGDYEPGNVRWGTEEQQARNKRTNRWIEYGGIKMILQDWAKYLNIRQPKLHTMLKKKSIEQIIIELKITNG